MVGVVYQVHETIEGGAYMTVDGVNDYLVIDHSDALALGKDGADFTVSFALLQTQELSGWRSLLHKGNNDGERTPAIWKFHNNNGFHPRISTTAGGNEGIDSSPVVGLNEWVYLTYLKEGQTLTMYYNGVVADERVLAGTSVSNDGKLYIGRDPWWAGADGAGFDNVQIHNRALTATEIRQVAAGHLLLNENCVLALDFTHLVSDTGTVTDLSGQNNVVSVVGAPVMVGAAAAPVVHERIEGGAYMTVDGVNDYLVIPHSEALALGKDGADFTVSFALLQTQENSGWRSLFHKGNNDG
jgi:hypothetical protein